ncbi:Adaptive-response sensory-kinase SasA [subsurface metagenome]
MENARYKILYIEDSELDQVAFKRFVENNAIPYDYVIVGSISEARSILGSDRFDIVISDHSLGDGTAFDTLDLVKDTPVIVITGVGDEETAIKLWKAGAYDYLIKDLEQNYLKAVPITVENAIRHKMTEEKLQLLSGAIMSTNDSVYITDMQSKIIFVNKAFCKTYRYKKEEIVGKDSNVLWIGKDQTKNTRSVFQTRTVGSTWEVGFYHKRKDDSIFPVSLSRSTIKDSNGHDVAIVAVARDISEQILIEDEFKTANLKLEKRNQLKNEVAIMVTEALQKLLADENIDKAKRIVCDYLDISKIDAGKMELKHEQFGLSSVVSQAVEALSPLAAEKNIELKSFIPDSELVANADSHRIAQVLTNLLSRAIKFSSANSHISVHVKDAGKELTVEIEDAGPPVERNEINKIANRTDWIKEQFHAGREDLALGLPIAKQLVEMHGGRLWAETSNGKENKLCFTVPKLDVRQDVSMGAASANAN